MQPQCTIPACSKPSRARSFCGAHYQRWYRRGDPLTGVPLRQRSAGPPLVRFWAKVDKTGPVSEYAPILGSCWLWLGTKSKGYGQFKVNGVAVKAHRFAYELLRGPILSGLTLDHLCRVRACVNPSHMEPVTKWREHPAGCGAVGTERSQDPLSTRTSAVRSESVSSLQRQS